MRVVHVLTSNQRRGAEFFGFRLHEELLGLGFQSTVVALLPSGLSDVLDVPVLGRRLSPASLRDLRGRVGAADVVVGHGGKTLLAGTVATLGRAPFVYANIGDPTYWANTVARRARVRWMLRRAAHVAAISPTAAQILVADFGVPVDQVSVIPNGRSAERFYAPSAADRAAARVKLGISQDATVVAFVGALSKEKRPDLAIRVTAALPETRLLIAGDGPERQGVEALAAQLEDGRARLLGVLDQPRDLYWAADALLVTSDSEGVPGVVIEAGLCGLPTAATDVGFMADVVKDGHSGRLAPRADVTALAAGLADVIRHRAVFGKNARERCQTQFELRTVTQAWARLLRDVVAAPRQPSRSTGTVGPPVQAQR